MKLALVHPPGGGGFARRMDAVELRGEVSVRERA